MSVAKDVLMGRYTREGFASSTTLCRISKAHHEGVACLGSVAIHDRSLID